MSEASTNRLLRVLFLSIMLLLILTAANAQDIWLGGTKGGEPWRN
jgi:hypothetical protein